MSTLRPARGLHSACLVSTLPGVFCVCQTTCASVMQIRGDARHALPTSDGRFDWSQSSLRSTPRVRACNTTRFEYNVSTVMQVHERMQTQTSLDGQVSVTTGHTAQETLDLATYCIVVDLAYFHPWLAHAQASAAAVPTCSSRPAGIATCCDGPADDIRLFRFVIPCHNVRRPRLAGRAHTHKHNQTQGNTHTRPIAA